MQKISSVEQWMKCFNVEECGICGKKCWNTKSLFLSATIKGKQTEKLLMWNFSNIFQVCCSLFIDGFNHKVSIWTSH